MEVKERLNKAEFLHIQTLSWYDVKFNNVRRRPKDFLDWKIVDDQLYFRRPDPLKEIVGDESQWKKVLKDHEVLEVLKRHHEEPDAGHIGRDWMYERLKVHFYWPGMHKDVEDFVEACETCKRVKYEQSSSKAPLKTRQPIKPWAVIAADITGPFPKSRRGHSYVLVVQDLYTRFSEFYPLRRSTGSTILACLKKLFSSRGYPMYLVTDNGTEFANSQLRDYLQEVGVRFSTIAVFHPQANPVERINRTLKPMIRAYIAKDQNFWDEHLGEFQLAYNSAHHSSLKMSPYFLVHGQAPKLAGVMTELELTDIEFTNDE